MENETTNRGAYKFTRTDKVLSRNTIIEPAEKIPVIYMIFPDMDDLDHNKYEQDIPLTDEEKSHVLDYFGKGVKAVKKKGYVIGARISTDPIRRGIETWVNYFVSDESGNILPHVRFINDNLTTHLGISKLANNNIEAARNHKKAENYVVDLFNGFQAESNQLNTVAAV